MNEERFSGKAEAYKKYRPSYPDEYLNYLFTEVGFERDSTVADVGSGTGILTELLLKRAGTVLAVEPNADMRAAAENNLKDYPNFVSVNATAENTGIKAASVDFITVAQAFHWFDPVLFKAECRRILKTGGKVALVWNTRDEESPIVLENEELNRKYCINFKGFSGVLKGDSPESYDIFFDGGCEYKVFRSEIQFNEGGFIGRNLSSSYAPKSDHPNYEPYIAALKDMFKRCSVSGVLCIPNITKSYVGKV